MTHLDEQWVTDRWQRHLSGTGRMPPGFEGGTRSVRRLPALYPSLWKEIEHRRCSVPAFQRVAEWLASDHQMLILSGPTGTWKSTVAAWAASIVCWDVAYWIRATELGEAARDRWLAQAMGGEFAVIDDLGLEHLDDKGWMAGVIDDAINRRYERGGRTIITTNLAKADFRQRYHGPDDHPSRAYRRMRDMTGEKICQVQAVELPEERCHASTGPSVRSLLRPAHGAVARKLMPELERRLKLVKGGRP